jgi:hypothetical protein
LAAIPQQRRSLDRSVPNRQWALAFLEGLFALSSVVLNGRAPGDVEGGHTCWSWSANDQLLGHSVVDYACVSVSLFQAVSVFEVLPFIPTASKDHSALYVSLSGLQPCYSTLRPRRQRVLRPKGSGYPSALSGSQGRFTALLNTWQAAAVPVSTALQQYIDLLVSCAEGQGGADTSTPAHTRDKPWFDTQCRTLGQAVDQAWEVLHASQGGVNGNHEECPQARAALVAARRAYKTCIKEKKREYELRCQAALLETYFGTKQKDFWRVFFADRRPSTALADVDAWTEYFRGLLGVVPQPAALAPSDVALKLQLYAVVAPKGAADAMSVLNDPVSFEEARQCMALAPGRAPDIQGLTGEVLQLAASDDPVLRDGTPVCPPPPPLSVHSGCYSLH